MKRYKTLKRLKKKEIRKEKIKRKPPFTRRKSRYANEVPIETDIAVKDAPESSLDLSEPANSGVVVVVVVAFFLPFPWAFWKNHGMQMRSQSEPISR